MPEQTLNYCALHYLEQWFTKDERYCRIIGDQLFDRAVRLATLKEAMTFYRVARCLRTRKETKTLEQRYGPLLGMLDAINETTYRRDPIRAIYNFQKTVQGIYKKDAGVLSMTTKILWIKMKKPFFILDGNAKRSLKHWTNDIASYNVKWLGEYNDMSDDIIAACNKLPDLAPYVFRGGVGQLPLTTTRIRAVFKTRWFRERVFDNYLWNKGTPRPKAKAK